MQHVLQDKLDVSNVKRKLSPYLPNATVEWIVHLVHLLQVPGSIFGPDTGYSNTFYGPPVPNAGYGER
jgi:hypothetical protein